MANEEHLAILRQGVKVWNQWRMENPGIKPNLRQADLERADLERANLTGANLQRANLYGAYLTGATLMDADLRGTSLTVANLQQANLQQARLTGAYLTQADLTQADLTQADLTQARLTGAILTWAGLTEANLQQADLSEANLQQARLTRANLTRANLSGANLIRAVLTRANLTRADFGGAVFKWTVLEGANLTNAQVGYTIFSNLDFRSVHSLDTIRHTGPSTIGIDTLYESSGDIPETFLRGCGVPDSMIEYARSLVAAQRPIDYYSVFISYSSQDEAIAQRLHADLQARGVRCWFAPHDLEIGAPILRGIDEAIRIYDKLLIILSEAAVTSRWVDFEVSTALHRELEQGRTMLFPIRLDDTVLHTPSGWATQLRTRNIGDFRGWKDHDRYQVAFNRLLRDLKAKEEAE